MAGARAAAGSSTVKHAPPPGAFSAWTRPWLQHHVEQHQLRLERRRGGERLLAGRAELGVS
jgi:hypothetical protein